MDIKDVFKDIKLPLSFVIGMSLGFLIGIVVGAVSGGFVVEVFFRSIMSGIILGGTFWGIEQFLKKFVPEFFEQPFSENKTTSKKVDITESDDISINDLYSTEDVYPESKDEFYESTSDSFDSDFSVLGTEGQYNESEDFEKSMKFSEENVFNDVQNESDFQKVKGYENENESKDIFYQESYRSKEEKNFEPISFSTAELGITRQSRGGKTEDFIIPEKGKPIPRDYKKLAEAIRTKLKED